VADDWLDNLARLVAVCVDGGRLLGPVPPEVVRRAGLAPLAFHHGVGAHRNDFIASALRATQHRTLAEEAVAALAAVGVPAALLKGASYGGWLYDDPALRPMTDVDLLVPLGRFEAARAALARLGFRHTGPATQRSRLHHAMTLSRGQAAIDLHRSPAQIGRIAIDFDEVWRRATPAPWIDGALRLEPVDEALFHFANLARSDLYVPLINVVDAGRLLRAVDREALVARATAWRFRRVLAACIAHVERLLGWRAHSRWWLPSREEALRGRLPTRWIQVGRKLLLIEGGRELGRFLVAVLHQEATRRVSRSSDDR
jgi:hypothetical protein